MNWDTPENYKHRRELLDEMMEKVIRDIPLDGPFSGAQLQQLRDMVMERSELLHWDVYNDSFSRNNLWLYGDYLSLTANEARFAILAFQADPSLRNSELGIAFDRYLEMVKRGRIADPHMGKWLKT